MMADTMLGALPWPLRESSGPHFPSGMASPQTSLFIPCSLLYDSEAWTGPLPTPGGPVLTRTNSDPSSHPSRPRTNVSLQHLSQVLDSPSCPYLGQPWFAPPGPGLGTTAGLEQGWPCMQQASRRTTQHRRRAGGRERLRLPLP